MRTHEEYLLSPLLSRQGTALRQRRVFPLCLTTPTLLHSRAPRLHPTASLVTPPRTAPASWSRLRSSTAEASTSRHGAVGEDGECESFFSWFLVHSQPTAATTRLPPSTRFYHTHKRACMMPECGIGGQRCKEKQSNERAAPPPRARPDRVGGFPV